jgi:hypothetical protein
VVTLHLLELFPVVQGALIPNIPPSPLNALPLRTLGLQGMVVSDGKQARELETWLGPEHRACVLLLAEVHGPYI